MTKRPTIGVTLDSEQPGGYSKFPWYAIRQNYADAIVAAGGLPIALPHDARTSPTTTSTASMRWLSPAARSTSIPRCTATATDTRR